MRDITYMYTQSATIYLYYYKNLYNLFKKLYELH